MGIGGGRSRRVIVRGVRAGRYSWGMNNDLVPERRADKNGVVSTKWVRPVAGGGTAVSVPAPMTPVVVGEDWDALKGSLIDKEFERSWLGIRKRIALSRFDYEAVCMVNELLERKSDVSVAVQIVFGNADEMADDEKFIGDPFLPLNNVAVFGELAIRPFATTEEIPALVNGLSAHFGPGRDYLHGVTVEERAAAVALVTVITSLENHEFVDFVEVDQAAEFEPYLGDYRSVELRSAGLAELVKARPGDAEEIARIINERDSDDAGMVALVLGSGHRSLNTGML